jgi:hypothetical protein
MRGRKAEPQLKHMHLSSAKFDSWYITVIIAVCSMDSALAKILTDMVYQIKHMILFLLCMLVLTVVTQKNLNAGPHAKRN